MKKYLQYKNEINGLNDVLQTIKATEKISASYNRQLKKETFALESYKESIKNIIARLSLFYSDKNNLFLSERKKGQNIVIVITGDKGLVGNLYHNLINTFLEKSDNYQKVISIGNKGLSYLEEEKIKINNFFSYTSKIPQSDDIEKIIDYIFSEFKNKQVKKIDIVYPQFISLSEQKPKIIQFLPFDFNKDKGTQRRGDINKNNLGFPIFEPSSKENFNRLLKKYIEIFFTKIIIESKLSEISARTTASEQASEKIKKTIKRLKIEYSKKRREIITQKQIENFISTKYYE